MFRLVRELAGDGFPVAVTCRVLKVSRTSYYDWATRPPSARSTVDAALAETIATVHADSRGTYGSPRVHAELRLGLGIRCGRKRVARIMRTVGLRGVCHRRKRGTKPAPATHEDLVRRVFTADRIDRIWFTDITQHRAADGWVYCAAVIDACSRRVVGWSIADHLRTELVADALQMAQWQRRPPPGTIVHADRGCQGGFRWSSQHLELGGVNGTTTRVGFSRDGETCDALAWPAAGGQPRGAGCVLAQDRRGVVERGRRGGRRCVAASGVAVVSRGWRHVTDLLVCAVGPLPVVR